MKVAHVDADRLARVAVALAGTRARPAYFMPDLPGGLAAGVRADFWCLVLAACQQTRTVRGVVAGRPYRGSDYLIVRALDHLRADPECFTPAAVSSWTVEDLLAFYSDDGVAAHSTLDRAAERTRLLNGLGRLLCQRYSGRLLTLCSVASSRVAGPGGIAERLAECEAYSDPARKKTNLLLLFLRHAGLLKLSDPDSIGLPVDYHIQRVLLRAGVIVVDDPVLARKLSRGESCTAKEDDALRGVIAGCGAALVSESQRDLFEIDNLLWMIGRNCCFYEHEPVCRKPKPCAHRQGCSLLDSTTRDCEDRCPLEVACRGAREDGFAAIRETRIDTHYY